ncbi:MAG: HEAT repeat domain-containing protein [Candidatus Brocadiia bacterium]
MNLFVKICVVLTGLILLGASLLLVHTDIQNNQINQLIIRLENYNPSHHFCEEYWGNPDFPEYAKEFASIGKPAIPALIKLINHKWPHVRYAATLSLSELNAKEAIPYLIERIGIPSNPELDRVTTEALIKLDARESIPKFTSSIDIKYTSKKTFAAFALGKFKAKEEIPVLIKLLKDNGTAGDFAAIALVEVGAKNLVPKEFIPRIKSWANNPIYGSGARAALKELGVEVPEENK